MLACRRSRLDHGITICIDNVARSMVRYLIYACFFDLFFFFCLSLFFSFFFFPRKIGGAPPWCIHTYIRQVKNFKCHGVYILNRKGTLKQKWRDFFLSEDLDDVSVPTKFGQHFSQLISSFNFWVLSTSLNKKRRKNSVTVVIPFCYPSTQSRTSPFL